MMDVARSWMDHPDYPIGAYLGAGLKDYVSKDRAVKPSTSITLIQVANPLGRVNRAMSMPSTAVATWTGRSQRSPSSVSMTTSKKPFVT